MQNERKDTEIQSLTSEIQDFQRNNVEVQNEIQRKNIEISNKDIEIKALRSKMLSPKQVCINIYYTSIHCCYRNFSGE